MQNIFDILAVYCAMKSNDFKILLQIDDMVIAEDIQRLLDDEQIYVVLESDHPASSVLNIYSGIRSSENVRIIVNEDDFLRAVEVVKSSPFRDFI